tara:strand:+ start:1448 stop:2410 length:963 start_codon:yes stop_codon:yes gene_type:complete
MRNLFLLILFFGLFFGIQIVYFENSLNKNIQLDFEDVSKSIVSIESVPNTPQKKFGSGVIISNDGYIVTAFHILSGTLSSIKIDQEIYIANLIGFDEYADLAVLKINEENLRSIDFPDNFDSRIGQTVFAIGNPYNLGISVSKGILSGTGRNFGNPYLDVIQTDAAINQGSSGGAIINSDGQLIGLSTSIASISGGSDGVGFALPAERVISIANEIIKYGRVNRAWIGDFKFKRGYYNKNNERLPALYVFGIDNSNINGGLKDGDIIIDIKGAEAKWNILKASVNSILPGEMLELTVDRSGEIIKLEIMTRERPNIPQVL